VAELDDRPGQGGVLAVAGDRVDEGLVDLEDVDREAAQVAERGVAGAEVVDRQPDAERLQLTEPGDGRVGVVHEQALGDLQDQRAGVEVGVAQRGGDVIDQPGILELAS
jgi:hypothetical protein